MRGNPVKKNANRKKVDEGHGIPGVRLSGGRETTSKDQRPPPVLLRAFLELTWPNGSGTLSLHPLLRRVKNHATPTNCPSGARSRVTSGGGTSKSSKRPMGVLGQGFHGEGGRSAPGIRASPEWLGGADSRQRRDEAARCARLGMSHGSFADQRTPFFNLSR